MTPNGPAYWALGPVNVVGYHVVIADATNPEPFAPGQTPAQFDVDLPGGATSLLVPKQFLRRIGAPRFGFDSRAVG